MAESAASTTTTPQRNLLNLPGELRNRIYELVIEDTPTDVRLRSRPYPLWLLRRAPNRVHRWDLLGRRALGLTQTCRKLRDEVLPLHQQHVTVQLWDPENLGKYTAEFFPNNEAPCGAVKLSVPPGKGWLEVLPFIHAIFDAPKLGLIFEDEFHSDEENLSGLCDVRSNKSWAEFVAKFVTRISYIGHWRNDQRLIIKIKHAALEYCMAKKILERSGLSFSDTSKQYERVKVIKRWLESIEVLSKFVIEEIVEISMEDPGNESEDSEGPTSSPNEYFRAEGQNSGKQKASPMRGEGCKN